LKEEQLLFLKKQALQGDRNSAFRIAQYYLFAEKAQDFEKTRYWLEYASSLGSQEAQGWLKVINTGPDKKGSGSKLGTGRK
jgi:TPR repeat protein